MKLAFKMYVYKDKYDEYKKRHREVFPKLEKELKLTGAKTYNIFLDEETGTLFAYVEVDDVNKWNDISKKEICKKWWNYMEDIMVTNEDKSPLSKNLVEVYSLY